MSNWTVQEDSLLQVVSALRAELASMRECFDAADRERSELRERAERAEADADLWEERAGHLADELSRLRDEVKALRAERDADRRREYGYSQETVDAITKERDALRETERKFGTMMHAVMAERDALQQIVADYPPIEAELEEVSDRAFKAEAERDALRAALELYRGQVDQTGRHSAADAIKRAAQALSAQETPRAAEVLQKPLD